MTKLLKKIDWYAVPLLLIVIVAAVASYGYHRLLLHQRDWIEHTYQVISVLETTLQRITDAETGQRGYLLTDDKSYLVPYQKSLNELSPLVDGLRKLVRDSPAQLLRVAALNRALSTKLVELAQTISMRDQYDMDRVKAELSSNVGRDRMDRIRTIVAQMRQAEADLILQRTTLAQHTEKHMLWVALSCALTSLIARITLYVRARARS